ncbi:MAG: hypothetical protein COA62_15670 [Rhodobiaceae bacterium]|nr:MAG: hypothetical protein COA62_15670 [Rhodobiaceae bacterium]
MSNAETTILELSSPLAAHGTEYTELTFRQPIGSDVMKLGLPMSIKSGNGLKVGKTTMSIDAVVIAEYVSRLASIPTSSVKLMSVKDLMRAQELVVSPFGEGDSDDVSGLDIREPNGADFIELGNPFDFSTGADGSDVLMNCAVVGRYIARLAKIPFGDVEAMSAAKFMRALGEVLDFFGDTETKTP